MNTTENNNLLVNLSGLLAQAQGIADKIGHILDFAYLVIVSQDDGVSLLFELLDPVLDIVLSHFSS